MICLKMNYQKQKIIQNSIIPVKGYKCTNLFGVLFVRKGTQLSEKDLNHEAIHTAQMKELLYVGFYILYGAEYVVRLCQYRDFTEAYKNVSFEREAYFFQGDFDYLNRRTHYNNYKHFF